MPGTKFSFVSKNFDIMFMKIFLALVVLLPSLALAQSSKTLVGNWQCDWNMTLSRAYQSEMERYQSSDQDIQRRVKEGIATRKFVLKNDGSLSLQWKNVDTARNFTGTWAFNTTSRVLTLTINQSVTEYAISFLNENTVVFKAVGNSSALVFDEIVLVKI